MTNAEIIQAIKTEIERLYNDKAYSEDRWDLGYDCACEDIMSFLPTLESEKPNQEGLEEEMERFMSNLTEKKGVFPPLTRLGFKAIARHFAQWQKEQMMKGAVECELYYDGDLLAIDLNMAELGYSERDKVRVIILKEEDEK